MDKKGDIMRKIIVIVLVLLLLVGCGGADSQNDSVDKVSPKLTGSSKVRRIIDEEAGVVCWTYSYHAGVGGIDCLPISETALRIGE